MVAQVRYSMARRSRGQVASCAVYTCHVEMRSVGFLVEPQNQSRWFVSGLPSKLVATVSPGLTSKSAVGFLVKPQNQGGGGFLDLGLKTDSSSVVIWGSKSP
jgi:hypothetical protein